MGFITSLIFAIMNPVSTLAQDESRETVSLPVNFQSGATADVSYTKTFFDNQTNSKATVKAKASMEIISADQAGPLISWTLKAYDVEGELPDKSGPVIEKLFIDIPTQFIADEKGRPIRLHNAKKLVADIRDKTQLLEFESETYKSMFQILDMWLAPTGEENIQFLEALPNDFAAEFSTALFFEIPDLISSCQGTDLGIGETKEYQKDYTILTQSLKMNVQYQLASVDRAKQLATIYFKIKSDEESQKRALTERVEKFDLAPLSEAEIEEAILYSEERAQCIVDSEIGWVQDMTYQIQHFHSRKYAQKDFKIEIIWH